MVVLDASRRNQPVPRLAASSLGAGIVATVGIADAVGAPSFAIIGQSSGAAIAMTCAQLAPSRVGRLVLVDLAGSPDERALGPVFASVSGLGTVYPSVQAAIALVKQTGLIPEWDEGRFGARTAVAHDVPSPDRASRCARSQRSATAGGARPSSSTWASSAARAAEDRAADNVLSAATRPGPNRAAVARRSTGTTFSAGCRPRSSASTTRCCA
jgi:pimeloyl-ACP methyl ester carboxylesterase